ncbi:cathepsin O isoform 2-T2 [Discoglossus pictus]
MLQLCFVWCVGLCAHIIIAVPINSEDKPKRITCGLTVPSSSDGAPPLDASIPPGHISNVEYSTFLDFMEKNHKEYPAGSQIFHERYQVFLKSLKRHKYLNITEVSSNVTGSAYYGINQFSDLSVKEFSDIYLKSYPTRSHHYLKPVKISTEDSLPLKFDWRDKNVVSQVKNQMNCGACWAFSVVGAVESAYAIKGHSLEDLSVQQVIDCSYLDFGCNGGSTIGAFKWLNKTQAKLVRTREYTFKAQTGQCHYFPTTEFGVSIKGFEAYDFRGNEEYMMKILIERGPLTVIVDAVTLLSG